jgi:hypothetical protein
MANGNSGACADIGLIQAWRKTRAGLSEPLRS